MKNSVNTDEEDLREENYRSEVLLYKEIIRKFFFVLHQDANLIVLEYLIYNGPKSFRQLSRSTRFNYSKLKNILRILVESELLEEFTFSLNGEKLLRVYDIKGKYKDPLKRALGVGRD